MATSLSAAVHVAPASCSRPAVSTLRPFAASRPLFQQQPAAAASTSEAASQQQHRHAGPLSAVACCSRQRPALRTAVQRQQRIVLASAAASAASPELPQQPAQPVAQQQQRPRRELSLEQRWRQLVVTWRAKRAAAAAAAAALPPIAALLSAWAALQRALAPVYAALEELHKRREALREDYNQFLAEETKARWRWGHRYAQEIEWWKQVPPFLYWFTLTLLYHAFTPVSVALSAALPLYFAWVVWDAWWRSPVFLATLLLAPLKWVPWAAPCWLWPGVL